MLEESVALFREVGDRELEPLGELLLGFVAFLQGEYSTGALQKDGQSVDDYALSGECGDRGRGTGATQLGSPAVGSSGDHA